jgi:hypothetical protein
MVTDKSSSLPLLAIVAIVVLLMGGAAWWLLGRSARSESRPVLTAEARGYLKNLALSEVQMQANESYLKQAVIEIDGKIGNTGERVVKLVEINCVFRDAYGQVVLRERVAIAGRKTGDLRPGETKSFRLAFDSIPESWNKQMPDLVIAQILFG